MDAEELNRFRWDIRCDCDLLETAERQFNDEPTISNLQLLFYGQRAILKRLEGVFDELYLIQHPDEELPPYEKPE